MNKGDGGVTTVQKDVTVTAPPVTGIEFDRLLANLVAAR